MREGQIRVESGNILPIIKKWLYSDKDIFLRELIANGCDAVKKLEELRRMGEAEKTEEKPRIHLTIDKEKKTLVFEDNGLGMTEEEVEKYITQVAFSGARDFVARYQEKGGSDAGIIGHFGLGFYSAFMVSDSVEIDTLSYRKDAKPVHWVSDGGASYQIGEGARTARGTAVTLHIADAEKEFLEEGRIREVLRKYCAFMPVEIYLNPKADGKDEKPVNDTHPLWLKAPKDCTDEEYKKFYSDLFLDFTPPLFWIHLNVDYPVRLKGILYFPKQRSRLEVMPGEIKLYSNQVYIADNVKEVVPEFLMLLRGVIDCPDLPLNVSRSFLQNDGDVQKIARHIGKKVSDKLHEIFTEEREKYNGYWDDISPFIKFGCIRDEGFYDRVRDILLFKTINGEYKTLDEFPKVDNRVYYVTDENEQAQYIRMFKEQGQTAAVLSHAIDSHFVSYLEYREKDLKFARIDSEIGDAMKNGVAADAETVIAAFKNALGREHLTVRAERLKSEKTPAVMLVDEYARRMRDMSKLMGEEFTGPKPDETIVLNLANPVVRSLAGFSEEDRKLVCTQVYGLAQLGSRSLTADETADFIDRGVELLGRLPHTETPGEKPEQKPENETGGETK